MAFGMLLLMFAALADDGPQMHLGPVIAGFVLFNFAMNAGPNATTFTLPPILFPTAIRASASGFAAACAKPRCDWHLRSSSTPGRMGIDRRACVDGLCQHRGLVTTAAFAHAVDREDELEEATEDTG